MSGVDWGLVVLALLVAGHLVDGVVRRGTLLPSWLWEWRSLATFILPHERNLAILDCYGSGLGLQEGIAWIQGDAVATMQGRLHGVFVTVTYAPSFWRRSTIVTADAPHIVVRAQVLGGGWASREPGWSALTVGEPSFDRAFASQAESIDSGAAWLTTPLRDQLLRFGVRDLRLRVDGGRITLSFRGRYLGSVELLDAALGIVLTAALGKAVGPLRSTTHPLARKRSEAA